MEIFYNERSFEIKDLTKLLKVNNPIFETKFISENESGGRKGKTKRGKTKRRY